VNATAPALQTCARCGVPDGCHVQRRTGDPSTWRYAEKDAGPVGVFECAFYAQRPYRYCWEAAEQVSVAELTCRAGSRKGQAVLLCPPCKRAAEKEYARLLRLQSLEDTPLFDWFLRWEEEAKRRTKKAGKGKRQKVEAAQVEPAIPEQPPNNLGPCSLCGLPVWERDEQGRCNICRVQARAAEKPAERARRGSRSLLPPLRLHGRQGGRSAQPVRTRRQSHYRRLHRHGRSGESGDEPRRRPGRVSLLGLLPASA
jgi:hypothetical protein